MWLRFQPAGVSPCRNQIPQAEVCATKTSLHPFDRSRVQFFFLNKFFSVFTSSCTVGAGWAEGDAEGVEPDAVDGAPKLGTPLPGCTFGLSIVPASAKGTVTFPTRLPISPPTTLPTLPEPRAAAGFTVTDP